MYRLNCQILNRKYIIYHLINDISLETEELYIATISEDFLDECSFYFYYKYLGTSNHPEVELYSLRWHLKKLYEIELSKIL